MTGRFLRRRIAAAALSLCLGAAPAWADGPTYILGGGMNTDAGNATSAAYANLVAKAGSAANALVTNAMLATMPANTVHGNATSGAASPTNLAIGSCSAAGNALLWTTNTGFGCNSAITAATLASGTITGNTTLPGSGQLSSAGWLGLGGTPAAMLDIQDGGTSAAAWTTAGIGLRARAGTLTDTSSSGTVAETTVHNFSANTLAASSATTYTQAETVRIGGSPANGTNVTITNAWALAVENGNSTFPAGGIYDGNTAPTGTGAYVHATNAALSKPTLTDQIDQEAHVSTSNFSSTGTSLGSITGLSQSLTAAGLYSCHGHVHFTTAPTSSNGVKVALATSDTLTVTTLDFTVIGFNGAAFMTSGTGSASALAGTAIASTNAVTDLILEAEINVNVAGTLQVQMAENAASGTIASTAGNARWECHRAS